MRSAALIGLVLMASGACSATPSPSSSPSNASQWTADHLLGDWRLVSGTIGADSILVLEAHLTTLRFDGSSIGGHAPCNTYYADARVVGQRLLIGDVIQTLIGCPGDRERAERQYMTALRGVTAFTFHAGRLVLFGPEVRLQFTKVSS